MSEWAISATAQLIIENHGYDPDGNEIGVAMYRACPTSAAEPWVWWLVQGRRAEGRIRLDDAYIRRRINSASNLWAEYRQVSDELAKSRTRHAGGSSEPPRSYSDVIDALITRGLQAEMHGDPAGSYIRIRLDGDSSITIGDYVDNLPPDPRTIQGWNAQYQDLSGDPGQRIYDQKDPDTARLVDAITGFVRSRNSEWIGAHLALEINQRLRWLDVKASEQTDDIGSAVQVTWDDSNGIRIALASYPTPQTGARTGGEPITGWSAYVQRPGDEPSREVLYDAPTDPRIDPLLRAMETFIREH